MHISKIGLVVLAFGIAGCSDQPQAKQLSPGERKEYERIQARFLEPWNHDLMISVSWTLGHCAGEKGMKGAEKSVDLVWAFIIDTNQIPKLAEAGGVKAFKDDVASLLKNEDPVVRSFGAVSLAVIGDAAYKSDIARLIEDKRGSPPKEEDRFLYNFDRSRAAMALGIMGAKEYAPRLSALLRSSDPDDRAGAALGLGYMGAKEYVRDIAKLLSDDEDHVQTAAMQALAELDAKEYTKDIAGLLTHIGDPMVNDTACYAIARLKAKEQAKELAALLNDRFRKGNAAKALALLDAKEYIKDIAQLTEDSEPLVRCDALIALAILDEKEYVNKVAEHLQDKETFVRAYAAVALLLMGDQTNSKQIVDVVQSEWKHPEIVSDGLDTTAYFRVRIRLHPVVAERQNQLTIQAIKTWERLNQVGE